MARLISRPFSSHSPMSPGMRMASTGMTQLVLMPLTIICSKCACCFRLLFAYRRMHPPDQPSALPVCPRSRKPRSTCSSCRACPPVPAPHRGSAVPKGHARSRTPFLRVNSTNAAAVAALPRACSDCACLPVVTNQLRLCTPVVGPLAFESTAFPVTVTHQQSRGCIFCI